MKTTSGRFKGSLQTAIRLFIYTPFIVMAGFITLMFIFRTDYFLSDPSWGSFYSMLVADRGITVKRNIHYGPHPRHRLDIYRPASGDKGGPIVMFIYGGGWTSGNKATYGFAGAALAAQGITTVIPDYRIYPEAGFPDFNKDVARAYRWLHDNLASKTATADNLKAANRVTAANPPHTASHNHRPVILIGHSAGAHIGALLTFDPAYLQEAGSNLPPPAGFVGLAGPYAFNPVTWPSTRKIFKTATSEAITRPIHFARPVSTKILLIHGQPDKTVRIWNMRDFAKALRRQHTKVKTVEFPDIAHVRLVLTLSRPFRHQAPTLRHITDFIRKLNKTSEDPDILPLSG